MISNSATQVYKMTFFIEELICTTMQWLISSSTRGTYSSTVICYTTTDAGAAATQTPMTDRQVNETAGVYCIA